MHHREDTRILFHWRAPAEFRYLRNLLSMRNSRLLGICPVPIAHVKGLDYAPTIRLHVRGYLPTTLIT